MFKENCTRDLNRPEIRGNINELFRQNFTTDLNRPIITANI